MSHHATEIITTIPIIIIINSLRLNIHLYFLTESKAHAKTGGSDSGLGTTIYSTTADGSDSGLGTTMYSTTAYKNDQV